MKSLPLILMSLFVLLGCGRSGPRSTRTTSAHLTSVQDKTDFLHQYVTFRRTYQTLDFDITYQNNSEGLVPGPSDWDVRLVAAVPASELEEWIPSGKPASQQDRDWLESVPTQVDLSGINEWYEEGRQIVGIDRQHCIVAYRDWKN
jgi:hypothetical protein